MNTRFEQGPRCSPAGFSTAAILVVVLAMGASTLFTAETPAPQPTAGTRVVPVAQSQHAIRIKKS